RENSKIGDIVFEIDNWNVFNANRHVLKDIAFNVKEGEVLGIAGLMGSGRTELAMSIFGKTYGDNISGTIKVHGKEVVIKSVKDAIENKIAYTSEDRKTYGLVLIDDIKHNMTMSSLKILFSKFGIINDNEEILKSQEYKNLLNLKSSSINQTVSSLSGGNQQKVVLAKWMLSNPDVLILDEPTRGIDVGAKYEIYSVINDLVKMGKAVIIISSELPEIIGMSDRVYVLNEGKIVGELQKEEIDQVNIMKCIVQDNAKN
uniref:ATP-binding cassette domain-containing protein n=1 Tax=Brachyspira aalborgi TaxID=29522 RepID=UPI00266D91F3